MHYYYNKYLVCFKLNNHYKPISIIILLQKYPTMETGMGVIKYHDNK